MDCYIYLTMTIKGNITLEGDNTSSYLLGNIHFPCKKLSGGFM